MEVGKCYLIDDGNKEWLGRITEINFPLVTLSDCSWVADTGRRSEFCRTGRSSQMEIEPVYHPMTVTARNWMEWPHPLLTEVV